LAIQPANPLDYKHDITMRCCVCNQQIQAYNLESKPQSIHACKYGVVLVKLEFSISSITVSHSDHKILIGKTRRKGGM
jgi:hypothetical protein